MDASDGEKDKVSPSLATSSNDESPSNIKEDAALANLSKRKRKKLEQQMKKKQYLKEKRQLERQRKKQRLRDAKAKGTYQGPSRKALKLNTMDKSKCKIHVVIDCSFDELMTEKFYITSFNKRLKNFMENIGDYTKWDVHLKEQHFEDVFPKDKIIYLSSDSSNVLQTLEEDKVYIIGGLVDHNHHKGVCLKLAKERGLAHAQLPIGDYLLLESRKVLAVNHVFDILLKYTKTHNWKEAFYQVIPSRKIIMPKDMKPATAEKSESDVSDFNGDHHSGPVLDKNEDMTENKTTTEDELFGAVGALKKVYLLRAGTAEVVFVKKEDALAAIRKYNNRELDGQPMKVVLTSGSSSQAVRPPSQPANPDISRLQKGNTSEPSSTPVPVAEVDLSLLHKALFKTTSKDEPPSRPVTFTVKI